MDLPYAEAHQLMTLRYETSTPITVEQFADLLRRSTLAERRPVNDVACLAAMLEYGNLLCTAWDGDELVGVARSVTDFAYCCYLSDLAVDGEYQRQGIGRELIRLTQSQLGPRAKIILLSAPAAVEYYPRIGFEAHPSAWVLSSSDEVV
jgi:ribosomal protein S18 acetylase RimI-like enzyme